MTILAIDPGPVESAYAVWDGASVLAHGKVTNNHIMGTLRAYWEEFNGPEEMPVYIEMIASYGMAVGAEVFETCVWIGRFEAYAQWQNIKPTKRLTRIQVKNHLCHTSRANDANIRQALIDRIGPGGNKKNPGPTFGIKGDAWAALAVAVTAWDMENGAE